MIELSLNEIRKIQIDLLDEFARICNENGLRYSLCGGTLLGAIRHGGYIPWDDDIDVLMPRPDYEKLLNLSFDNRFSLVNPLSKKYDKPYIYSYAKLYDNTTILIENMNGTKIESKVYIDIFPIDGIPSSIEDHVKLYRKIHTLMILSHILELSYYARTNTTNSFIKKIFWNLVWLLRCMLPYKIFLKKATGYCLENNFDNSLFVGTLIAGYGPKERFKRSGFFFTQTLFEKKKYSIISGFDDYLTRLYDNYMELPPVEKRILSHNYKAYRK